MLPASQTTGTKDLLKLMKQSVDNGIDPLKQTLVLDLDSSNGTCMLGMSPCLTRSRALGHWVSTRGRRQTIDERLRLMGINPADVDKTATTDVQLGRLIGNAIGVNVLERILYRVLPAACIIPQSELQARWESLEAARSTVTSFA